MKTPITDHFTLEEVLTTTHTDIVNRLPQEVFPTIVHTAQRMEIVRALLGNNPIKVNSWYRSKLLNKRVGGSKRSQHLAGEAVDFTCESFGTPYEICQKLILHKQKLWIDQLIYEGSWVHISFVSPPRVPRLEVLTYMVDESYRNGLILNRGDK